MAQHQNPKREYDFFKTYDKKKLLDFVSSHAEKNNPLSVLAAMDLFAQTQAYMMNLGPENRHILEDVLHKKQPQRVLEFGAYCGYSAICIARMLPENGHLVSVESSKNAIALAPKILQYAGLDHKVTFVHDQSQNYIQNTPNEPPFDVVFIDHIKKQYLSDLHLMETHKTIANGSIIVADNVGLPGTKQHTQPYLEYVRNSGKYISTYHPAVLAYNAEVFDALEVSCYKP